jgi:hydroxymethylpyrimidine pyrophosphatase-like HAD family hydrolase
MTALQFGSRRFNALATDYDGTLAENGAVSETTLAALTRFKARGGALVLVTGRILPELKEVFPRLDVFDLVVAENGALLYWPLSGEVRALAAPPPATFVETLTSRGVGPIQTGHCIVATWTPHEVTVLETIKEMGLELSIIFNKGAVMILPTSVNKASGLEAALSELRLQPTETIGVGDAENDLAFLKLCGLSVAVGNALESVKQAADWTTPAPRGDGVAQVLDSLLTAEAAG